MLERDGVRPMSESTPQTNPVANSETSDPAPAPPSASVAVSSPDSGYAKDSAVMPRTNAFALEPKASPTDTLEERNADIRQLMEEAFAKTGKWVELFREMLGVNGVVRKLFPGDAERNEFEASETYAEIQEMIAACRGTDRSKPSASEPERMLTIRVPKSVHEVLIAESKAAELSINQFCISKLIQPLSDRHVPQPHGKVRGRRPGPQPERRKSRG